MVLRRLLLATLGMSVVLLAQEVPHRSVSVTQTERMDFPAGGVLHLKHSIGELKVEGWDEPAVELITSKAPLLRYDSHWQEKSYHQRELEEVRVTAERHSEEIVVTTTLPHRRSFPPPSPLRGSSGIALEYRIKVPHDARLIIEHEGGEVHIEDLTGDIHATTIKGEIALRLPEDGQYDIDAKSDFGDVVSDFPGRERRRLWLFGHRFVPDTPVTGQKLYLRVGAGDIIIQKIRKPPAPTPLARQ